MAQGPTTAFGLRAGSTAESGMHGTDSWVKLRICNKHGDCCQSPEIHDVEAGRTRFIGVSNGDSCHGLVVDKFKPDEDGQIVAIEDFGPDGVDFYQINVLVGRKSQLHCDCCRGEDGTIDLPGNERRRLRLTCQLEFVFRRQA